MSVSIATKGIINAPGPGFSGGGGIIYRDKPITKKDILIYLKDRMGISTKLSFAIEDDNIMDLLKDNELESGTKLID